MWELQYSQITCPSATLVLPEAPFYSQLAADWVRTAVLQSQGRVALPLYLRCLSWIWGQVSEI